MSDGEINSVSPRKEDGKGDSSQVSEKITEKNDKVDENEEESAKEQDDTTDDKSDDEKRDDEESEHDLSESTPPSPKKVGRKPKKIIEEDEDESEEELPPGLLERPVIIESGKREKRKVDRLSQTLAFSLHEKKKIEIPEGRGVKLISCVRIEHKIAHTKTDDLRPLHRIMYLKVGTLPEIKKNIKQFSGFAFTKADKDYNKRLLLLSKITKSSLIKVCDVLDIEKTGNKDNLIDRIMTFLLEPEDSGKKLSPPKKRRSSSKGENKGVKRKRTPKKKKESEDEENDEDVNDSDEEDEVEPEEKPPRKKIAKIEKPKKKNNSQKKDKKEKSKPKVEKKKKKEVESDSDSDSDDEMLSKKRMSPPNNDEIKEVVKKILDGANLEEVTMKTVVKQVYAKYPSFDLSDKKDFIKTTVKQLIS